MKQILTFNFLLLTFFTSAANDKDSVVYYPLPDSIKAVSFLAEVSVGTITTKKEIFAGISTDVVKLSLESGKKEKEIVFEFPSSATVMANGLAVKVEKGELSWNYNWMENENYKLLIATAGDSAGNFALYSGYIFLPKEKKWKLIGTCKISGQWNTLKQPATFRSQVKNNSIQLNIHEAWCQRNNGSWKNLFEKDLSFPVVNLLSQVDSLEQLQIDKKLITQAIAENNTDAKNIHDGVYYTILKEGTGRQVSVNDTVTVYYKGYLLKDGSIFDQSKDKPATFPLKRLIMGWQIGVPLCKVGGKIKIIIPSNLAYSIRTRGAKIPPNSILVFEIEVVDAKAPQ
jgi:FKBP-type peptidyl-prolyl cis-trans isomerase FkpA